MKFNNELNKEALINLYFENKEYIYPIIAIAAASLLFIFLIIPQVLSFPSKFSEMQAESVKLDKIKKASELLSNANPDEISAQLAISTKALPNKKDLESVLGAIAVASGKSQVQVESFNFSDVSTQALEEKTPTLNFQISTLGTIDDASRFLDELYKTYPVSDLISFTHSQNVSKISIDFYYKAFSEIKPEDPVTVSPMSNEQKSALQTISVWSDSGIAELDNLIPEASVSAGSPF